MIVVERKLHSLDNHTKEIGTGIGPNAPTTTVSFQKKALRLYNNPIFANAILGLLYKRVKCLSLFTFAKIGLLYKRVKCLSPDRAIYQGVFLQNVLALFFFDDLLQIV